MAKQKYPVAQNPLILRCHRLMEAFAKSDDERDFYLDTVEGFIFYADLDKASEDLAVLEKELEAHEERYRLIPKMTYYETKKIMEGFVHEKVYDIDTKEKLIDIIQSKEARENFLEFVYEHDAEWDKWQQFYQERSRIRIIEWLRGNQVHFVFEEDLDLTKGLLEKLKEHLFDSKVAKDIQAARKELATKAKTYYSNEALNPRPKRGRPPKQVAKPEVELQVSRDIYTTVGKGLRLFLFSPDMHGGSALTFSAKFETEEALASRRQGQTDTSDLEDIQSTLASLRSLSSRWMESKEAEEGASQEEVTEEPPKKRPMRRMTRKDPAEPAKPKRTPKKRIMPAASKKK